MIDAYQRQQHVQDKRLPRIDVILSVFDEILGKLSRAAPLLEGAKVEAHRLLHQCQIAVAALAASLDPKSDEVIVNLRRLYEFVTHSLSQQSARNVQDAIQVLTILREGFEAIRTQAIEMERQGAIPRLDRNVSIHALA